MANKFLFLFLIVKLMILYTFIEAKNINFKTEEILSNLDIPWGMTFLDKNTMIINEKDGDIFQLDIITKKIMPILNRPKVYNHGQGGLLDIQISPNYKNDNWIYFTYVKNLNGLGVTVLARSKFKNNYFYSWEELLVTKSTSNTNVHFGSRITFDEQNHIYFSIGDRGYRPNGQDLNTHSGSIVRLNLDGSIPKDNPFVGKNGLDEIFTYGHRNPQGLFYDKKSKTLYSNEHGPRGGDEINIIEKGKNYGWPIISYGKEYYSEKAVGIGTHQHNIQQPIKVYIPSIAPSSLIVYSGKVFKQWAGNILNGALVLRHINKIELDKNNIVLNENRLLKNFNERIRNIIESPDGLIYLSTDSGRILRINKN